MLPSSSQINSHVFQLSDGADPDKGWQSGE